MNYLITVFLICLVVGFGYPLVPNVDENLAGLAILTGFFGGLITFFCILVAVFKKIDINEDEERNNEYDNDSGRNCNK
jgi:fluoride ion exporter CrcB/FEX